MSIAIYSPSYSRALFIMHVESALRLLLLDSIAVYFPTIVPMFYNNFHSSKARNQKNQHRIATI